MRGRSVRRGIASSRAQLRRGRRQQADGRRGPAPAGSRASVELADLNEFRPLQPVAATTCFRAIYYARDRRSFLRRVAGYTKKKVVFDVNPRRESLTAVAADLRAAGFDHLELRPFFVPQRVALSRPLAFALELAEHGGPLSRLLLRFRFSYIVAASRAAFSDAQSH